MARFDDPPSPTQRAATIAAVAALHVALFALALGRTAGALRPAEPPPPALIDIALPPPPPPPPAPPAPRAASAAPKAGAPGATANPRPVAAPTPRLRAPTPLAAAPVAGSGAAATQGAADAGTGPGAGGTGNGTGAGGNGGGGGGGGIGEDARLLSGGLDSRDYRRLRRFAAPSGRAVLAIMIGADGRVVACSTRSSSGDAALDAALCGILQPRMRWAPARDRAGRALSVGLYYTAVWSRD